MARARNTTSTDDAPTLDEGLGNVLFDVWLVSRATTALVDDAVLASGLDADEFAIYSVLSSGDGMTPTELAHWMSAPATTVSSYVKRFERRGHVRRDPNPDDGRSYRVALTVAGRRVHAEAGELFRPLLDEVTRRLGGDVRETHRRLQALHDVTIATGTSDESPPPPTNA
jgi:DNA-binding MarR family transcriptional regulator